MRCLVIKNVMASVFVQRYFSSDEDFAKSIGRNGAKKQYVALKSPHAALAQELCKSSDAASNGVKHIVQCETISIEKKELMQLIDDVCNEELASEKRKLPPVHTVILATPSPSCQTNITANIVKYTLPIAYNVIGTLSSGSQPMFAVRLVWEKHSVAFIHGKIHVSESGNYTERDSSIKYALIKFNADKNPAYPLAIADFFCQCAVAERVGKSIGETGSDNKSVKTLAPELRALLLVDEIDTASLSL